MSGSTNRNQEERSLLLQSRALSFLWRESGDLTALFKSAWIQVLSVGINASQSILLPIMVGPAAFGLYAGLYTNMMVAIGIGRGPIEILIQRGHTHGPDQSRMIYRQRGLISVVIISLVLATAVFTGLSAAQQLAISAGLYLLLIVAVAVGAASGLRRGLLVSTNRTSVLELLDMVCRPALFLVAASVCWWQGYVEPLLLWLLGTSFVLVLLWPNLKAARAAAAIAEGEESAFRPWSYLLTSTGLSVLVKNADIIVMSTFLDAAAVGRYFIIARLADLAAFGYSFASARFVHRFATARRNEDWDVVQRTVKRATNFGLAIALSVAAGIIAIAPFLLPLVDPALSAYMLPLAMLLVGQIISAALGVRGAFLTAIEPRRTLGIKLIVYPFAILAMVLAVPAMGPTGAAAVMVLFAVIMQTLNAMTLQRVLAAEKASAIRLARIVA